MLRKEIIDQANKKADERFVFLNYVCISQMRTGRFLEEKPGYVFFLETLKFY